MNSGQRGRDRLPRTGKVRVRVQNILEPSGRWN